MIAWREFSSWDERLMVLRMKQPQRTDGRTLRRKKEMREGEGHGKEKETGRSRPLNIYTKSL
jgi:hypothetical protein